jgi:hypothetical protein
MKKCTKTFIAASTLACSLASAMQLDIPEKEREIKNYFYELKERDGLKKTDKRYTAFEEGCASVMPGDLYIEGLCTSCDLLRKAIYGFGDSEFSKEFKLYINTNLGAFCEYPDVFVGSQIDIINGNLLYQFGFYPIRHNTLYTYSWELGKRLTELADAIDSTEESKMIRKEAVFWLRLNYGIWGDNHIMHTNIDKITGNTFEKRMWGSLLPYIKGNN